MKSKLEKFIDQCLMFNSSDPDLRLIGLVTWIEIIGVIATIVTQIRFNKTDMDELQYVSTLVFIGIVIGFAIAILVSIWSKRK